MQCTHTCRCPDCLTVIIPCGCNELWQSLAPLLDPDPPSTVGPRCSAKRFKEKFNFFIRCLLTIDIISRRIGDSLPITDMRLLTTGCFNLRDVIWTDFCQLQILVTLQTAKSEELSGRVEGVTKR